MEVVGVLPHIQAQNRHQPIDNRIVLIRGTGHCQLALGHTQPGPAAAKAAHRRLAERRFEVVKGAKGFIDG